MPEAALDARLLLEYVCGTNRNTLLVHGDRGVTETERARYEEMIHRRAERFPLQYLIGEQEFMGLKFLVNEHVLIPRQDTEILTEEVLRNLHDGMRILDMCTGSGCIILSLLHYSNRCKGVGADISREALEVARRNAERIIAGKNNAQAGFLEEEDSRAQEVSLVLVASDLFRNIKGKFDVIVSNPPYIRSGELAGLMPEVREYEPLAALDGGEDGLGFYRRIIKESGCYLMGGGMLYLEIGCGQASEVTGLMEQAGYRDIRVVRDYASLDRVVYGTWMDR